MADFLDSIYRRTSDLLGGFSDWYGRQIAPVQPKPQQDLGAWYLDKANSVRPPQTGWTMEAFNNQLDKSRPISDVFGEVGGVLKGDPGLIEHLDQLGPAAQFANKLRNGIDNNEDLSQLKADLFGYAQGAQKWANDLYTQFGEDPLGTSKEGAEKVWEYLVKGKDWAGDKLHNWFGDPEAPPGFDPWSLPEAPPTAPPQAAAPSTQPGPIDLGSVPFPDTEQYLAELAGMPYPAAPDYSKARQHLAAAAPRQEDFMPSKEDLVGSVLLGLGQRGFDPNQPFGSSLFNLALGGLAGYGAGKREATQGKKEFARAGREYNLGMADVESSMAGQDYQYRSGKYQHDVGRKDKEFGQRLALAQSLMPKVTEKGIVTPFLEAGNLHTTYTPIKTTEEKKLELALQMLGGSGTGPDTSPEDYTLSSIMAAAGGNKDLQQFIQSRFNDPETMAQIAVAGSNTGAKDASVMAFSTILAQLAAVADDPSRTPAERQMAAQKYRELSILPAIAAQSRMRNTMTDKAFSALVN